MTANENNNTIVSVHTVNNMYGYRYNLNHPKVRDLYKRYAAWKKISGRPFTDAERFEFESYLDKVVKTPR